MTVLPILFSSKREPPPEAFYAIGSTHRLRHRLVLRVGKLLHSHRFPYRHSNTSTESSWRTMTPARRHRTMTSRHCHPRPILRSTMVSRQLSLLLILNLPPLPLSRPPTTREFPLFSVCFIVVKRESIHRSPPAVQCRQFAKCLFQCDWSSGEEG